MRKFVILIFLILSGCSYRLTQDSTPVDTRFSETRAPERHRAPRKVVEAPKQDDVALPPEDPNFPTSSPPPETRSLTPREEVRHIIMNHKLDIRSCYTKFFGFEHHKGQMIFEWEYNERGRVVHIHLTSSDFKMPRFEACVKKTIQRMTFPQSNQDTTSKVRFPFQFQ